MKPETPSRLLYTYDEKGLPMRSALSPLLGAIALPPWIKPWSKLERLINAIAHKTQPYEHWEQPSDPPLRSGVSGASHQCVYSNTLKIA